MTELRFTVTDADTAIALGSGDLPVLATPRLLAWLEAATVVAATELVDASSTTVGVEVSMRHRRASAVGALIAVEVRSVAEQDRGLAFEVVARQLPEPGPGPSGPADGQPSGAAPSVAGEPVVIATGHVVRAVVDRASFLARL
ncbi:MAG: hypothetical protein WCF36_20380 [Candidatus Nanopelagicales bacterium]